MTSSDMERNRFGEYIAGTVYKLIMFISSIPIPDIELELIFSIKGFRASLFSLDMVSESSCKIYSATYFREDSSRSAK